MLSSVMYCIGFRSKAKSPHDDRHLDQQRDTTAHRVDTGLLVELHRRLLALHGILLARIFLGQLINLGP